MKKTILLFLLANSSLLAQIVVCDKIDKKPIESVNIYCRENFNTTNIEGKLELPKTKDTIIFKHVNYEILKTTLSDILKKDTLFLTPKSYALDEIIIKTKRNIFSEIGENISNNYMLEPHEENFFLRAVVYKNGKIEKLVDIAGKVQKAVVFDTHLKPILKNNFRVKIDNIRKAAIIGEYNFNMFTLGEFFKEISSTKINTDLYNLNYETSADNLYTKIIAQFKDKKINNSGSYIVNNSKKAFEEFSLNITNFPPKITKNATNHETLNYSLKINFSVNSKTNKYYLSSANLKTKVVANTSNNIVYDVYYYYYAIPHDYELNFKKNTSLDKTIFEIKGDYNENYWTNNILPLTTEMQEFINKVNSSGKNSDFRTITNIK